MTLSKLIEVLTPPLTPIETGRPGEWERIEHQIGSRLPDDYKAFIQVYGTGMIGNFLKIWNPFSANRHLNLIQMMQETLDILRSHRTEFPDDYPHKIHPEKGGLLPFGDTIDGDVFFWETDDNSSNWNVLLLENMSPDYEEHHLSLVEFLDKLLRGEIAKTFLRETSFDNKAGFKVLE